MTKDIKTTVDLPTSTLTPTSKRLGEKVYPKEIGEYEMRLNQLEARMDYNDRLLALLMKDREASIRLVHGRMNNEIGLQVLINGWKDEDI